MSTVAHVTSSIRPDRLIFIKWTPA